MDLFISWSGRRSQAAAEALRGWLPKVINAFKPWLSSADLDKGSRWALDVAVKLEVARAGIICLTPSNLHADWIMFEAGALSKTLESTFVCPLLIGLDPADLKGPLSQFQATRATREDILRMLKTLNAGLKEEALSDTHIDEAFDVWWPKLENALNKLPDDGPVTRPARTDRDLLEEVLETVRALSRRSAQDLPEELASLLETNRRGAKRRDYVVSRTTSIASQVIYAAEPDIQSLELAVGKSEAVFTVAPRHGKPYEVAIPITLDNQEIESYVKARIPRLSSSDGQKA